MKTVLERNFKRLGRTHKGHWILAIAGAATGQCITNLGKAQAVDLWDTATRGAVSTNYRGAWGSGNATPALANTTLTEHPETRVATTISQQTTSTAGDTIRHVWTVTASANRSVEEAGVFDATTSGNLIYRGVHALLNIETGDQVTYTFNDRHKDATLG